MSDVKWTTEQLQAIEEKGSNILVAAAAGSGKTAVLVERIIHKIIDDKIDIDKMLVVTFTNAAASEMRERILEAIYKQLEKDPTNSHLQKQVTLLNKASICTIHAFCLDVIRNQFYELDLPSNFRIAETAEIDLLKQDVLDDLFEQKYTENDEDFLDLLETYTNYKDDEPLKDLLLSIYRFIQSSPFPEKWLQEKVDLFNIDSSKDFVETPWGQVVIKEVEQELKDCVLKLKNVQKNLARYPECSKFYSVISEDIVQIETALSKTNSWNEAYNALNQISLQKWPVDKKVTIDLKEEAKEIRDKVKKTIKEKVVGLINSSQEEILQQFENMYPILQKLQSLILEFSRNFAEKKKEKNCIDFNDIEHFALKILLDENGNKTITAKKYEEKFEEIAIDEYQDSNLVQEAILTSISKGNNIFMVGDVKQSIYKFRQARPELFLQKYASYKAKEEIGNDKSDAKEDDIQKDNIKIQLFRNFRSRNNILDITNLVFETIMSKELGDIDYNENEYLNYGANYPEEYITQTEVKEDGKVENEKQCINGEYVRTAELNIIDMKEDDSIMAFKEENIVEQEKGEVKNNDQYTKELENTEEETEELERIEDDVLEARFVAKRIKELLKSGYKVYDKKNGYRQVQPKDIVILLRATAILAPIYEKELSEFDLPVFSDSSTSYLDSVEIETILSLLKIIDNPMQDIPLVVVLRSIIGGFTDNELITIRLTDRNCKFYEAIIKSRISYEETLKNKIEMLLEKLNTWREKSEYLPLDELIWQIYLDTGYYQYVGLLPNGAMRQANLKTLFEKAKQYENASFKGLFHFIQFIEKVKKQNNDSTSAKLIGENANVIRIMSIHKSKGLEFPIVFLCNSHKKFNLKDLNDTILMHQDLGFGPTLIDTSKKFKYTTVAKQAIALKVKQETLSEEERILYVVLTRAKEKLIITGRSKDLMKSLSEKEKSLAIYQIAENFKIESKLIKSCNSYLDWLEYVYLLNSKDKVYLKGRQLDLNKIIQLKTYRKDDLIKELQMQEKDEDAKIEEKIKQKVKEQNEDSVQEVKKMLDWQYKYEVDTKLPTKTSVSKLKNNSPDTLLSLNEQKDWEEDEDIDEKEAARDGLEEQQYITNNSKPEGKQEIKTQWIKVEDMLQEGISKITSAQKGTLVHLCIQKLDEQKDYNLEDIQELILRLVEKEIITEVEANSIDAKLVYLYTQSELFKILKQAKEIHKEQPFYINIPAKDIFKEAKEACSEKSILVQGVIDLYYIDQNDKINLIDFKTDYVPYGKEQEIADKYKIQINIYRKALEQALGKNVATAQICLANKNWQCVSVWGR